MSELTKEEKEFILHILSQVKINLFDDDAEKMAALGKSIKAKLVEKSEK